MVLERLGQVDAAAAESETDVGWSPKSAQAHYGYGAFLEKHARLDEAIAQNIDCPRLMIPTFWMRSLS
jgi:Tfp pilus assembly protein PilF